MSDDGMTRLEALSAALRDRAPLATVCVCTPECCAQDESAPGPYLQVTYRQVGPWRVVWADLAGYVWASGPAAGAPLSAHPVIAADAIADALGVGGP